MQVFFNSLSACLGLFTDFKTSVYFFNKSYLYIVQKSKSPKVYSRLFPTTQFCPLAVVSISYFLYILSKYSGIYQQGDINVNVCVDKETLLCFYLVLSPT